MRTNYHLMAPVWEPVILGLVITGVVMLDSAPLLWPAVLLTFVGLSAFRWYRGIWPWPSRQPLAPGERPANVFLHAAFTSTIVAAALLIAGTIGYDLSRRSRFLSSTAWTDEVIWWELGSGVIVACASVYFWFRGLRWLPSPP